MSTGTVHTFKYMIINWIYKIDKQSVNPRSNDHPTTELPDNVFQRVNLTLNTTCTTDINLVLTMVIKERIWHR